MAPTPPIVLCMVLCDGLHTDPRTQKKFVLGTCTEIVMPSRAGGQDQVWLFAELTNGHGLTPIEFRLVHSLAGEVKESLVISTELALPFANPRQVHFVELRMDGALFGRLGEHRAILASAGRDLVERRLIVIAPDGADS